jgi:Arylsulfotransferase (ASST).
MRSTVSKAWFVISVAFLAFLAGFAIRATRVPPNNSLEQAWMQARSTVEPPTFLKPRVHDRSGVRLEQPDAMQDGVTLLTSTWKGPEGWSPRIRLINRAGDVLHEWRIDETALFTDSLAVGRKHYLHGSHLLSNGDVLFNVEHGGTARVDACGNVEWRLPIGTHHSIDQAADGSFWISDITQSPRQTDRAVSGETPGLETAYLDRLTHVSADGRVLRTINVLEVLYANDLSRYISKSFIAGRVEDPAARLPGTDPTHLNDVESLPPSMADAYPLFEAGDLLISLRNIHLVLVLDPDTETVKWHASDPSLCSTTPIHRRRMDRGLR